MDFIIDNAVPLFFTVVTAWIAIDFALICAAHKHFERRRMLDDDEYFGLK